VLLERLRGNSRAVRHINLPPDLVVRATS
jgi:DNA-binding LacI/PurR family transcriptional regulator